jgi:transposase-like protein
MKAANNNPQESNNDVVIGQVAIITSFACRCPRCDAPNTVQRLGNATTAYLQCASCRTTFTVRKPRARATA